MIGQQSRFNPAMQQAAPQQQGSLVDPQSLGMLMQAYKAYQEGQTGATPGATGTGYALQGQEGLPGENGAGYGIGSPLVAGGQSGQPMVQPPSSMPQQTQDPALLQAMLKARQMGQ